MRRMSFQAVSPAGLVIDAVTVEADRLLIAARPASLEAVCPQCGRRSGQVHSRYDRRLMDLPSHGRAVHLHVRVRRFRCGNASCPRAIFGEPLAEVAPRAARRTSRLEGVVHHLGIALGGRPAASLARRLMLPVSRDTLLRVVRRRAPLAGARPVTVIGIDDFPWKRGQRYGRLVCDLDQRRIIDLLPDRGGGYGQAASIAAPQAVQVADRWHVMENASAAFLEAVRRSMRSIREVLSTTVINPSLLTCAERIQHDGFLLRQDTNRIIKALAASGMPIKKISRQTGRSRNLVRSVLRDGDGDVFRCRSNILAPYLVRLGAEWDGGCRNDADLWRRLRAAGFRGGVRVVAEWATRRRRNEEAGLALSRTALPARLLSRLLTTRRDHLSRSEAILVATIETGVPALGGARDLMQRFHHMLRACGRRRRACALAGGGQRKFVRVIQQRHQNRPGRGESRAHRAVVERTSRGSDHQTEAGQTPDVWTRKARPVARKAGDHTMNELHRE